LTVGSVKTRGKGGLHIAAPGAARYSDVMKRIVYTAALCGLFAVSACAQMPAFLRPGAAAPTPGTAAPLDATGLAQPGEAVLPEAVREVVSAPPPPAAARTAEQFDTTTADQRAKAEAASATGGEVRLGETVGSLGDPTQPGFWIRSPLVKTAGPGRIEFPKTGKSALVELVPLDGPASGGSQVSLAALRLLDVPITDLPTLIVYAN